MSEDNSDIRTYNMCNKYNFDDIKMYIDSEAALGMSALETVVKSSATHSEVSQSIHSHGNHEKRHEWLERLIPGIEKITVKFHAGNFVAIRDRSQPPGSRKIFESMPIYARFTPKRYHNHYFVDLVSLKNRNASPFLWQGTG